MVGAADAAEVTVVFLFTHNAHMLLYLWERVIESAGKVNYTSASSKLSFSAFIQLL